MQPLVLVAGEIARMVGPPDIGGEAVIGALGKIGPDQGEPVLVALQFVTAAIDLLGAEAAGVAGEAARQAVRRRALL